jgi:Glycosyltransferase family 87
MATSIGSMNMVQKLVAFFLAMVLSVLGYKIITISGVHRTFGNYDFLQYWSAFQILITGGNPYDGQLMLAIQQQYQLSGQFPVMMWNPPWLPLALSPLLAFPIQTATQAWAVTNGVLCTLSVTLLLKAFNISENRLLFFLLAFSFLPVPYCMRSGQIGLLLLLGICLILFGESKRWHALSGLGLWLTLFKPHIFYLILIVYGVHCIRKKIVAPIVWALLFLGLSVAFTYYLAPASVVGWIASFYPQNRADVVPIYSWRVPTLIGLVRDFLNQWIGYPPLWPMVIIPGTLAIGVMGYLVIWRPQMDLMKTMIALVTVSYLTSPYGWFADQVVLLVPIFYFLAQEIRTSGRESTVIVAVLAVLILIGNIHLYFVARLENQLVWFPIVLLLIQYWISYRVRGRTKSSDGFASSSAE